MWKDTSIRNNQDLSKLEANFCWTILGEITLQGNLEPDNACPSWLVANASCDVWRLKLSMAIAIQPPDTHRY